MKLHFIPIMLLSGLLSITINTVGTAQIVTFRSTTITPAAPCDHVIQMILRYGVNNQLNRTSGSRLVSQTTLKSSSSSLNEPGDLEILQVNSLPPIGPSSGPRFAITVLNQSKFEARDFYISTVAVLGQIQPHSPISTVKVDRIDPGEAIEVSTQLPVEALSMGRINGSVLSYDKLLVAIDCFNKIVESDEANNVRLFEYTQVQRTASSMPSDVPLRTLVPALSLLERPNAGFLISNSADSHNPVDALDLEQPTPDSLRSAIQSITPPATSAELPLTGVP